MGDKLLLKLNIYGKPIANKYCEGKVKRTLKRGLKDLKSLRRKWQKSNHLYTMYVLLKGFVRVLYFIGCPLQIPQAALFSYARGKMRFICGSHLFRSPCFGMSWAEKPYMSLRGLRAILPKWLLLSRLETRTKESIQYASVRVEKPERIRKLRISC